MKKRGSPAIPVFYCLLFWAISFGIPPAYPQTKTAFDEKAVADFYRGKTVTILVGHSAGGGFDTYARLIGRHIGKYIPGNPNVIVTNMSGAGTMISVNHMYQNGPKDGTLISSFDGGIVSQQLFGTKSVQFDLTRLFYLGAPDSFLYIMAVTKRPGIQKFEEILGLNAKQVVAGATPNTGVEHATQLIRDVLGSRVKMVSGYKGTAEIRLAMKSGEVDSVITDWGSLRVTNLEDFKSGEWLILAQMTESPIPDLPQKNVPLIYQFAKEEEQRQLLKAGIIAPNQYARPYALPPGVPTDRALALETAFAKVLADERFLADAQKTKLSINPIPGKQISNMIVEGLGIPAKLREKLKPILLPGG